MSYTASGAIHAGQCVYLVDDFTVHATSATTQNALGIAAQDADDGDPIAVYGPGNLVRCRISGTAGCTVGDTLGAGAAGYLFSGSTGRKCAILIDKPASDLGVGVVYTI